MDELPTVVTKPPKTRSKLIIYLVAAIVLALVVIVVVINIVHRLPDDSKEVPPIFPLVPEPVILPPFNPLTSTTHAPLIESTVASSSSTSESSSSSSEDHRDSENSALVQVTTTVIPELSSAVAELSTTVETATEPETSPPPPPTTTSTTTDAQTTTLESTTVPDALETSTVTPEATVIPSTECSKTCSVSLVETIPRGVWFTDRVFTKNAFESWAGLLGSAVSEIDIFAYKMNLRGKELRYDVDNSTFEGRQLFDVLEKQAKSGVLIKLIDCQPPTHPANDYDADELERLGLIHRHGLDMSTLNGGVGGIQHSKTFIVDDRHLFVGSMNFEWKSFSQKLELGLEFHDCPCIAQDAARLFDQVFNSLHGREKLELVDFPKHQIGNSTFQFLTSPSFLLNSSSSWDLEALLNLIYEADEFVDIAVMQYFPSWIYFKNREFFSQIDNAIRMSVSRGVNFRILVSGDEKEEQKLMFSYLHSLSVLHSPVERRNIQVKFILIPQTAQDVYKDRKMHAKFMVSESRALVGSSNLAPEYFYKSTGTAVLIDEPANQGEMNRQIKAVFDRYWHSKYSQPLAKFGESKGFLPKSSQPSNPFSWFGLDRIGIFNEKYTSTRILLDSESDEDVEPVI